ncbi:MAG: imidazole glycerol phosphate synthase subunit HisH [Deltaproteobacteria bacterium]|jgi:glutamine amidotransferase|nr:imidazole glycerol phosphate synthase subunit HisH [Deltaproteobacteria bacterium]
MPNSFLAIIDYKAGNQTSVRRALRHLSIPAEVTADPGMLREASGVVFPGVGAAGQAMAQLRETGLDRAISDIIGRGVPFLGICLGCQIMLGHSEENDTETLGVLPGRVIRFDRESTDELGVPIRVPHMGWNSLKIEKGSALFAGIGPKDQFYFVHSYYPVPEPAAVLSTTYHGGPFCSAFGREGLWAVQFHPEKSAGPGLRMLRNFHDYSLGRLSPQGDAKGGL